MKTKFKGELTPEDLENIARDANFSSMGGDEDEDDFEGDDNFEGEELYDGYDDDMVDFGGKHKTFLEKQMSSGRVFTMSIENKGTASVDKTIILNPAYTAEGRIAGAIVITDGNIVYDTNIATGGLTVSGNPKTVQNFLDFIAKNPTQILGFKVKARTYSDQLEESVYIRELSPFKDLETRTIHLATFQDEDTFRDKVVTVPEQIYMTDQTEVAIKLLAGEKITVTWYIGGIVNTAVSLSKKHNRALNTASKVRSLGMKKLASNGKARKVINRLRK